MNVPFALPGESIRAVRGSAAGMSGSPRGAEQGYSSNRVTRGRQTPWECVVLDDVRRVRASVTH
jgi:hypothetical protein